MKVVAQTPLWPRCERPLGETLGSAALLPVRITGYEVRFESPVAWAELWRDDERGELTFRFDAHGAPSSRRPMGASDAVRLEDAEAAALMVDPVARTQAELDAALARLDQLARRHCMPALSGDLDVLAEMDRLRARQAKLYGADTRMAATQGLGDAIARGDWETVVGIYDQMEHAFNVIERWDDAVARQNVRTLRWAPAAVRSDRAFQRALIDAYEADDYGDGTLSARQQLELAVGDAIDREDWEQVIEQYEAAPALDILQRHRLKIARTQLSER